MLVARALREVLIAVPKRRYDGLVARLATEQIFHVEAPPKEFPSQSAKLRGLLSMASEKVSKISSYFSVLGAEPLPQEGLEIEVSSWDEAFKRYLSMYEELDKFYEKNIARLLDVSSRIQELERLKAALELVKDIDVDVRTVGSVSGVQIFLGLASAGAEAEISRIIAGKPAVAALERTPSGVLLVLAARREVMRELVTAMLKMGVSQIAIPRELPGSPAEAYKKVSAELAGIKEEAQKIRSALLSRIEELSRFYAYMLAYRDVFKVLSNTAETATMSIVRGFVDESDVDRLKRILKEELGDAFVLIELARRRGEGEMPTKASLPPLLRPFHNIVRLYGEPSPKEVIPTLFLAITFPVVFGLMFPDAGHGLLLILFAQLYLRKRSPDWAFVISVLGFASIVTGLMAAELFGPKPAELLKLPGLWKAIGFEAPPLALPTYAIEYGLEALVSELMFRAVSISLVAAAVMLTVGAFLGAVNAYIAGEKEVLLAMRLPKFLIFTLISLPFLATFSVTDGVSTLARALTFSPEASTLERALSLGLYASFLWLLLGEPVMARLHGHSFASGLGASLMDTFETILMIAGNLPSFLRIMALAMAHSSIMLAFAVILKYLAGAGPLGLAAGVAVYIIGNLMVTALEGILAFAQSLRLHFYEWFSKFYTGGGIPFAPIGVPGVKIVIVRA